MRLAGVELHAFGVVLLVAVAIDALATLLRGAEHVVYNHLFVEVLKASLVDGQLLVADVGGRNQAVAEPRVYAVGRHMDAEGLEAHPLSVLLRINLDADVLALCFARQPFPVVDVGTGLQSAAQDFLALSRIARHGIVGTDEQFQRHGGHVHGDGHVDVVGIDAGQLVALSELSGHLRLTTGNGEQAKREKKGGDVLHCSASFCRLLR